MLTQQGQTVHKTAIYRVRDADRRQDKQTHTKETSRQKDKQRARQEGRRDKERMVNTINKNILQDEMTPKAKTENFYYFKLWKSISLNSL